MNCHTPYPASAQPQPGDRLYDVQAYDVQTGRVDYAQRDVPGPRAAELMRLFENIIGGYRVELYPVPGGLYQETIR